MRRNYLKLLAPAVLAGSVVSAHAAVTISTAPTQNMTCSGGVCAPTATDAVLNVVDLQSLLASGNVAVTTTGTGVQATEIRIKAALAWPAATTLSLDAFKSVVIENHVNVVGGGGLSITTNDGGKSGEFACIGKGRVTFAGLSGSLLVNGTNFVLVRSIAALARAIAGNPGGQFALAKSYDAARDGTYAAPPIPTIFRGSFNGLGNTISNLTIDDPAENAFVGLFAETANGANILNLRLANETVTGGSGSSPETSQEFVGGLIGTGSGTIANVFASGSVTAGEYSSVGGLIGISAADIRGSITSMSVSDGALGNAGGLAGETVAASIADSGSTGSTSGSGFAGGLVGFNVAPITHAFASGTVTGTDQYTYAGGLVGINEGRVLRSSASGAVICQFACGGLAGMNGGNGTAKIVQCYALGDVTDSKGLAGGLVGYNQVSAISNSYATGAVSGSFSGGLVGDNAAGTGKFSVSHSYGTGKVTAAEYAGGLIGYDEFSGGVKRAYWDTTTSGITDPSQGAGNIVNDPGIHGLSSAQLQSGLPRGFDSRIWSESPNINGGFPYLLANPPPK